MDKIDPQTIGCSMNVVDHNIRKLRELFPEVINEGKLNAAKLREVVGDYGDDGHERFGLTWNGKSDACRMAQTPTSATLRPIPSESVEWDTTRNLFIEGENLESLKVLQKSFHKRVKMIYIDPPYNTGREFIYTDRFQDNLSAYLRETQQVDRRGFKHSPKAETAGRNHTNWLNMMYPRLKLARHLLRDDGVMFVSIGDEELHNLRHLLDELFGPENFVTTIVWQKAYAPKSSAKHFSADHDYVVVYARDGDRWRPNLLPRTGAQDAVYKNPDGDPRGDWRPNNLAARNYYSKGTYSITCPGGRVIEGPPAGSYWRISKERFEQLDADGRIWWGRDGNNVPAPKLFLSEVKRGRVPQTLWSYDVVGHSQEAKKELLSRLTFTSSASVFETPKPSRLIMQMLRLSTEPGAGDVVLDFFAGSGTTGDAVMQLNATDGGNRRFILVQLPEPTAGDDYATIADIAKARLRSAGKAIAARPLGAWSSTCDCGFAVFRLDASNFTPWNPQPGDIVNSLNQTLHRLRPGRTDSDLLYELMLRFGLDLAAPIQRHTAGSGSLYVIAGKLVVCLAHPFDPTDTARLASVCSQLESPEIRVVFMDASFCSDVVKMNTIQLLRQNGINDITSL